MTAKQENEYRSALKEALHKGYLVLKNGGSALDAVEAAVLCMENCVLFNAGKGAVFNNDQQHELDAAIMDGKDLEAGAVACLKHIKNPIALAKMVLLHSPHVLMIGKGAEQFAKTQGIKMVKNNYFSTDFRLQQLEQIRHTNNTQLDHATNQSTKMSTVGAVALDAFGNLAAATSTGGLTNKRFGRVGDTPIIGAGTYANNATCAISATGTGEYFMRAMVAYDISALMQYTQMTLKQAANEVIHKKIAMIGGDGGIVGIDAKGNIAMPFNTEGMYRAYKTSNDEEHIAIYKT